MNDKSIYAALSKSLKEINQDYCLTFQNQNAKFNGIIVADGMGSSLNSHIASEKVAQYIHDDLMLLTSITTGCLEEIFYKCGEKLISYIKEKEQLDIINDYDYGTTLICLIETENSFIGAYVGNGGILHLKGNFSEFDSNIHYLPWCLSNYLNPHTVLENGKNALYKYFSFGNTKTQIKPVVIEIQKDLDEFGDIFIVCTDGIFSNDELMIGKEDEQIWVEGKNSLANLLIHLKNFFKIPNNMYNQELELKLKYYLDELETNGEINDDCTIGIIITDQVFKYQKMINDAKH